MDIDTRSWSSSIDIFNRSKKNDEKKMDLLNYDSMSSNEDQAAVAVRSDTPADMVEKPPKPISSPETKQVGAITSVRKRKRKRGSVTVIPAEQASSTIFQRTVPHRRGHWAGHVFVPVTNDVPRVLVDKNVEQFQHRLEQNGYSGVIVRHSQLHLSLSKHFSLQLGFLDSFVDKLAHRLAAERTTRLFLDHCMGMVLVNEERTRSFWSWKVRPNATFLRILQHVDSVLEEYDKPLYYDPPTFHISLASFAGDLTNLPVERLEEESSSEECSSEEEDEGKKKNVEFLRVDKVVCKFGTTKSYSIPLVSL